MILEKELEDKFISQLSTITELSSCQFVGSRQTGSNDEEGIVDKDDVDTIIAIHTGYRQNDAFSLSPITVSMSMQITTRLERDKSGQKHEAVVEAISDKLSYWHKYSATFTDTFDLSKMFCGELRMNGGSGRSMDDTNGIWTESISFAVRGSERYLTTD